MPDPDLPRALPFVVAVPPRHAEMPFELPCGCVDFFFWADGSVHHWWRHNTYACGYYCEKHDLTVCWEDYYTPWPAEAQAA